MVIENFLRNASFNGSLRANSSSIWRGDDIFSRSTRESEDDEDALKWASLEKLPTYDRVRKGILNIGEGGHIEVDIKGLGYEDKKNLLDRLLRVAEEDNEKFLLKLRSRIDRVGLDFPTIEVRYEHLNIDANAYVGSRGLPSFTNTIINALEALGNSLYILPSKKRSFTVLHDVSGIIKPHRMTLLLGPPASGKTTLLLALAGKLSSDLKVSGSVTYNGHELSEFVPQRSSAYISQHDLHIPEMTVRETLAFSARCQGVGPRYDMLLELVRREKEANIKPDPDVDVFMKAISVRGQETNAVTDYVLKVTSKKDQQQYWIHNNDSYRFVSAREFAKAYNSFHVGQKLAGELSSKFDKTKSHPAALSTSIYGASKIELLKACAAREFLLMKRNSFVFVFRTVQVMIMASVTMTLFFRTHMHHDTVNDGGVYMGVLFFTSNTLMFNGFAELSLLLVKLPIVFKQRDYLFYPAWAYALPNWILKIPLSFVEIAGWVFLSYYVIGYDPSASRLFKQYLLLVLLNQMGSGLFRFIAVVSRDLVISNTVASFSLLVIIVLGGFVISHDDIKKMWIWGYWISPLMYAQNALSTNEFLGKKWSQILPGTNQPVGVVVLKVRGMLTGAKWYWIGVGALIGYTLLFNSFVSLGLSYLKPLAGAQSTVSEEFIEEKNDNIREESAGVSATTRSNSSKASTKIEIADTNQSKKGMVLPFTPLAVTFDNIRYSVDMPPEMKANGVEGDKLDLLKGVSGSFRPGVLTALMGVSGAGKTTLMDVLAGRKTGGYIVGNVTVSGYPKNQRTFARVSGYCEQNDIHSPNVTVYESLMYSAWLRLPAEVDDAKRKMFIEEVMELVELKPLRESLVGLPGVNGLSTEQRKRLTIAVELVANPSIIFMDEPTSGLDARAAAIVMRAVRNTVDTGRTVVCTIHQPSIDIFEAFDELFLMKRGGEEIYVGPLGHHSCHLINYYESIEGISKIKDGYNPATWMLEVTALSQEEILGINFVEVYKNSELYKMNKALINDLSVPPPGSSDLNFPTQYSQSFSTQCIACLWKQWLSYWRNPPYTSVRFFFTLMIAILFGSIFWGLGSKRTKHQDLFNAMGSMYAAVLFMGISYASSVQPVVAVEKTGQVAVEIPYVFVQSTMYSLIVYSMIGFEWKAVKFLWYLLFSFLTLLYYTFYGMMAVGLTPTYTVGAIVSSAFYGLWSLFSGFVIPRTRMPVWWRWYYWLCPVAWTLYGMVTSQFGDVQDTLESGETVEQFLRSYFGFRHDLLPIVAIVIACFGVFFALVFAAGIKFLNFNKR
ncbi:uncharacterized protein A4U43_C03F30360 [Asparagus officinalis]|uniref:ABC transporter domain-containing protein n=1 Tax=Asparagus officinalis TaxID=4686 RepID=A0A5P1FEV4_ASPOF|nr:uncharacterized protein A4U43_C03F30360 [Asparagus officinalis]